MTTADAAAAIHVAQAQLVRVADENIVLSGEASSIPSTPVSAVAAIATAMGGHLDVQLTAVLLAQAQLAVALAALEGQTPPPATALIFERSDVLAPADVLPPGIALGMTLVDGVAWFPPADGVYRKLYGGDSSKGKHAAFCVGQTADGHLEWWIDDGSTIRIATLPIAPGKNFFFAASVSGDGLAVQQEGDVVSAPVNLPKGVVPFDGAVVVGQGFYGHKLCDPINPAGKPAAKLLRLRAYRAPADPDAVIAADAARWADLLKEAS